LLWELPLLAERKGTTVFGYKTRQFSHTPRQSLDRAIPPSPIFERISYRPSFVPGSMAIPAYSDRVLIEPLILAALSSCTRVCKTVPTNGGRRYGVPSVEQGNQ
jgi:hypothetical protein